MGDRSTRNWYPFAAGMLLVGAVASLIHAAIDDDGSASWWRPAFFALFFAFAYAAGRRERNAER